nr:hypothetical protein [Gemmata obscuriglobus]
MDERKLRAVLLQRPLGGPAAPPFGGLADRPGDGRHQPDQVLLQQVIVGPGLERLDGDLLTDGARHQQKRHPIAPRLQQFQRLQPAERGQRVVGDDDVPPAAAQRGVVRAAGLHALGGDAQTAAPQLARHQHLVIRVVLNQQDA